jgi:murein hydrolase activator
MIGCAIALAARGGQGQPRDDLASLRGIGADVAVAKLFSDIETTRMKHLALEQEQSSVAKQRELSRRELRDQVRALYRITHPGLSPAVGGMGAVLRHVGRVKRLRRIVERQARGLQSLEGRAAALRAESGKTSDALEQAQTRLALLQTAPDDEAPGHQRAEERYGLRIVDDEPLSSLESERGRLSSPVSGDVRIVPGRVAESEGPGLQFQAPVGTVVRAVAEGRVAFSDRYGGYGRLVVLDHGQGFYTAYGGLGEVEVRVGDELARQARIGDVGTDLSPPALFFEIRKGSRTLEPTSWLGY